MNGEVPHRRFLSPFGDARQYPFKAVGICRRYPRKAAMRLRRSPRESSTGKGPSVSRIISLVGLAWATFLSAFTGPTLAQDWAGDAASGSVGFARLSDQTTDRLATEAGRSSAIPMGEQPYQALLTDQEPKAETPAEPQADPAAEAKKPDPTCKTCCRGTLVDWSKFPATIHPMARPGFFPIPPTEGAAYYSLWDQMTGECRQTPPKSGYAPFALNAWPFFDADWRYVEGVDPCERTFVEQLKRMHLNECWLLSTGGEYWMRHHNETNSRLTETNNDYSLHHVRTYADLWYKDSLRIYGEFVWADAFEEDLPPLATEVDRGDIQNLFFDLRLFDYCEKPVFVRVGRQEMVYGSQRLLTGLPWANKRHTFQGVKIFRQGEKWDFDAFWTQFVPSLANDFDRADENQNLAGTWLTYRPKKGEFIDFYYLLFDNENSVTQQQIVRTPLQAHTVGSRWAGDQEGSLWDFEAALQFGEQGGEDLFAAMATAGLGRQWKCAPMTPTAWLYYDFASGDDDPTGGAAHTFNPLFPFGHYYMGWADLVNRQNIHDLNAHLYLYPARWLTTNLQYHRFWLAEGRDALYNAGGAAYRRDPTGTAGSDVGHELDLVLNFHLTRYSDVLVSYAKLFGGDFLENTASPTQAANADALYLIYQQRW